MIEVKFNPQVARLREVLKREKKTVFGRSACSELVKKLNSIHVSDGELFACLVSNE